MIIDIVDRLRSMDGYLDYDCEVSLSSIADEIETLRAKVASPNMSTDTSRGTEGNIYKMDLHQSIILCDGAVCVTRVSSGWVYNFVAYNGFKGGIIFVPYDNTFQGNHSKVY